MSIEDDSKEILEMKELGYTPKEISSAMGISHGHFWVICHRAKIKFHREKFADDAARFSIENGVSKTCQKFDMTKDAVYMARVRLKKKLFTKV